MKKQDLINEINEMTKNLQIPDSISPENMKKMLDEQADIQNSFNNTAKKTTTTEKITAAAKNYAIRRLAIVACITLCLLGGISTIRLNQKSLSETASDSIAVESEESADYATNDTPAEEMSEDRVSSETKIAKDGATSQTDLRSPSSYDEYYETITDAYHKYYDRIASVTYNSSIASAENKINSIGGEIRDKSESESVSDTLTTGSSTTDNSITNEESSDFSTTNTQEKSIDEGDIIKTDGTYIYKVISSFNEKKRTYDCRLTITKTDNGNMKLLTTIDLNPTDTDTVREFHEFYLYNNYLITLCTQSSLNTIQSSTKTNIVIFDITDKNNPKELKSLTQSGHYESSRISDGFLYTVSNFKNASLDTPTPYSNYIPSINDATIDCSKIYYTEDILMKTTYLITGIDLNSPTDYVDTAAIPTNGGQLYVSDTAIYIYSTLNGQHTEITKIFYNKGILSPGKTTTITGYLYNSFALNEYKEHLRIVATIPANNGFIIQETDLTATDSSLQNKIPTSDVLLQEDINVIYILDKNMQLSGKLSGIAPGEKIYSARFMGDVGYFVTFRNMDPLFSVDLSNPSNPTIIGQLKIPGFSNYLHSYDDNLLFGLGEEINATTGDFLGLKLSMFDISNPANVTENDKLVIDDSIYSNAQYNHKEILINPEKNIIGFLYEATSPSKSELGIYYVTYTYKKEEGFIETARYPITDTQEYHMDNVRGVYIGNILYIATNKSMISYPIGSTEPIAQIYFH